MKYAVEMGSDNLDVHTIVFFNICPGILMLIWGIHRHGDRKERK
jgi:hypothetical protein